jgi:hypothetical protein
MADIGLAMVRFPEVTAATNALVTVRDRSGPDTPWIHKSGLVEHHHNGHWVLRGTFAGHYVDIDEALHTPSSEPPKAPFSAGAQSLPRTSRTGCRPSGRCDAGLANSQAERPRPPARGAH